jgi:hypothetical protein
MNIDNTTGTSEIAATVKNMRSYEYAEGNEPITPLTNT